MNTIATGNINNAPSPLKMSVYSEIYNNEKKITNNIPPIILLSLYNIEELILSSILINKYFNNILLFVKSHFTVNVLLNCIWTSYK